MSCGPTKKPEPKPPDPFIVQGRVVDAETGKPLTQARVRFQAMLPTLLGPRTLTSMESVGPDGSYQIKIGAGWQAIRAAQKIRIEAGAEGYAVAGVDLPVPKEKQDVCKAPELRLAKAAPKSTRPRPGKAPVLKPPAAGTVPWKE